ncbi:helix-turn-helix transcriptional regulator [Cellulomonas fengjieae]|uniref:helix-turn-helix transcriptional regulator n=1 Tax=Cellulomonas fengjieae TaxID=2819978 RepID=UPI001AAFC4AB|nr:WYL domain-containing protein [Cellulomonas fengjieae]MBO3102445.1 WYL domain-containing protein [Cellulomonas fengjieae]
MNRTDRLYALAEELRRVGRAGTTSTRLARLFEVSPRTVKRDVSALQQAGLPVVAQAGLGGGYVLAASVGLPPVNFTPAQAVALSLAVHALPPGSPFRADAEAARGKVLDALPPADRARADELAGRVWYRADRFDDAAAPLVLRAVEEAIARHRVLAIEYRSAGGAVSRRRVEPMLLARTEGRWYLVAWCLSREAVRWFRLPRIGRADLTPARYDPRPVADVGEPPADARPVSVRASDENPV